jgi:hypothetical protein
MEEVGSFAYAHAMSAQLVHLLPFFFCAHLAGTHSPPSHQQRVVSINECSRCD